MLSSQVCTARSFLIRSCQVIVYSKCRNGWHEIRSELRGIYEYTGNFSNSVCTSINPSTCELAGP